MHHPADRITHTTAFVTPVVEHWLEREIATLGWRHNTVVGCWTNSSIARSKSCAGSEMQLHGRSLAYGAMGLQIDPSRGTH